MTHFALLSFSGAVWPFPLTSGHFFSPTLNAFAIGALHPLSGIDHIFAMVAVGVWGATVGGRALWVWPIAFVTAMVAGFALGVSGLGLPIVEPVIATSIVVIGVYIACAVRAPVWLGALLTGLFAIFHGHAHGTDAVGMASSVIPYATGFALATAALHAMGIGVGLLVRTRGWHAIGFRAVGGIVALTGVSLVFPT
jgi:urease accessory protein